LKQFNNWKELLMENNYNKKGRPYKVPEIVILHLAKIRVKFNITFRQLEVLMKNIFSFEFPKYTLHQYLKG
jgi:hypothetical protein